MSAPDTNIAEQIERHKGPLVVLSALTIVTVIACLAVVSFTGLYEPPPTQLEKAQAATLPAPDKL